MKTKTGCIVIGMLLMLGGLLYASPPGYHSADYNPQDWKIELGELLRLIQFYNSGGYHVDAGAADGYGPGPGSQDGAPHDSDYNPQNWKIELDELLRLAQIFNSDGYHLDPSGPDGYAPGAPVAGPKIISFSIDDGATTTMDPMVRLTNTVTGSPTQYMASESSLFTGASWQSYGRVLFFTLSDHLGTHTVYFKVRNGSGESLVRHDTIFLSLKMINVAAGTFTMGNSGLGDDYDHGLSDELPRHAVTLSAYQIGKYDVTNAQYCDVLNWAKAQGYLKTSKGAPWVNTGDVYAGGDLQIILALSSPGCNIEYSGSAFSSKTRTGLPGTTNYSMDTHPVVEMSWYGAVAFCNWLSQMQGLTLCYDMTTANWPLTVAPPTSGGYRLPTEAEWERAAAWNGSKHWIYGRTSDIYPAITQCNFALNFGKAWIYVNPLGLTTMPYTSPVGWFNGVNVSPNENATTADSPSPVGAYDMCGNVREWCQDYYVSTFYSEGPVTNPVSPFRGTSHHVLRGGDWFGEANRSALRGAPITADQTGPDYGFRLAKS